MPSRLWTTGAHGRPDRPSRGKKFAGRLQFFKEGILNHCDCPIDTGKLEGVNNKIKLIKRRAFGYHDPDYFALKVKQAFPGRPATPKNKT